MAVDASGLRDWGELRDAYGGPISFLNTGYLRAETPVPTNIPDLDRHLCGGLRPGLHVIGGEPGGGKSALALFLAMTSALAGANVFFASLEMSANQCWSRCASCISLKTGHPFTWGDVWRLGLAARERRDRAQRAGSLPGFARDLMESDPVGTSIGMLRDQCAGLLIADDAGLHEMGGIEAAAYAANRLGMSMLVVDYLQYVDVEGATDEYGRVSAVSKRLNRLGVECRVPVLAIASLSRSTSSRRQAETPSMHSFKGSGDVEYNALSAWIVDRDPDDEGIRRIHIVKNRFGSVTGEEPVRLRFDGAHNSFELADR